MPTLGLGLEITSDNRSLATKLANNSTMLIDSNRALNNGAGVNSPFTNPLVDQSYNGTDLTLVNFAGTTADGYEVITAPNGRQVTALKCDGVDSYGILPNVAGLDPTGLDDFGMAFVIKTGATLQEAYVFTKNDGTFATTSIAFVLKSNGQIGFVVGDGLFWDVSSIGAISVNSFYKVVLKRRNGRRICVLDGIEVYNQPDSANIVSRNFVRLFARASGSETTHASFFNGYFLAGDFTLNPSDRWEQDFNNYCLTEYGL